MPRLPRQYRGKQKKAKKSVIFCYSVKMSESVIKKISRHLLQTRLMRRAVRYFFPRAGNRKMIVRHVLRAY